MRGDANTRSDGRPGDGRPGDGRRSDGRAGRYHPDETEEREAGEGREVSAHRVCVIGTVTVDGEAVTKRQAAILSILALSPGRPVDTSTLISAVWRERVPDSARASLQNQITRLRRRFGSDLIRSGRPGYELVATTDVEQFEQLVTDGSAEQKLSQKRAVLGAALEIFVGRPFSGLDDDPGAEAEQARLEALRDQASECLARAHLAAGDHVAAIDQLRDLVETSVYDEVRWELLMRAQVGAGRPAEAIATFSRLSGLLERDLGTSPCEELVALKNAIVAGEFRGGAIGAADVVDLRSRSSRAPGGPGCGGSEPIRERARCARHRIQRTIGGAS